MSIDISESLANKLLTDSEGTIIKSSKISHMLKDVDTKMFTFDQGFLECGGKKVSHFNFVLIFFRLI